MATPSMSMNKVIHCAVRRDLKRFRAALDSFQDGDRERAAGLHRAWENFDTQLTHHHEGEHEIAWPALLAVGVDQSAIDDQFDEEHDAMAAALREAGTAMAALASSASRADADAAATAMAQLEEVTVTHLDNEEAMSEPLFAEKHDDPAIKEMGKKFGKQPIGRSRHVLRLGHGRRRPRGDGRAQGRGDRRRSWRMLPLLFGRRYRKEVAPVWATSGSH